jgi:hypothetical protein
MGKNNSLKTRLGVELPFGIDYRAFAHDVTAAMLVYKNKIILNIFF